MIEDSWTRTAEDADVDLGLLEILCHLHCANRDKGVVPLKITLNHCADFAPQQLVDPIQSFRHFLKNSLEGLVDLIEGIALNDVALFIFVEGSKTDSALDPLLDLFHFILMTTEGRHLAIEDRLLAT